MSKVIFMGTPHFACVTLEAVINAGHEVCLVVCQPDKKQGRGQKLSPPPVKKMALEHNIEVFQPTKLKSPETHETLASYEADFFAVVAYGRILPQAILDLPKKACINVHGSLLPLYRGAAPIHFALLEGQKVTGVTTMKMDAGLDTGDMLQVAETKIELEDNIETLSIKLAQSGGDLLVKTMAEFDSIIPVPQPHEQATHTRLLTKEDRVIDWSKSNQDIFNQLRAFAPKPGLTTGFRGKGINIKGLALTDEALNLENGALLTKDEKLFVGCGQGTLQVLELQPESKKSIEASQWLNGYQLKAGESFE
ncbi:MAG: methionyl-tRNA formyltransferase [SAR324 cluster bacterium]|nr:methionyl-tRNA formyltransferase [SAR324 cluster bacterium]